MPSRKHQRLVVLLTEHPRLLVELARSCPGIDVARARPDRLALSVIIHGHKRGSLQLTRMAMVVAQELLAQGDQRSMVLADLIVGSIREEVRTMQQEEMDSETGWGKTYWFSEIGKAVADSWAEGRRIGRIKGRAEGLAKGKAQGLAKGEAQGLAKGEAKGKVQGLTAALWMVLHMRQLEPTERQRARIEACRDLTQLERWLQKALLAKSVAEIFRR